MTATDIVLVVVAFGFGFAATRVRLPAMVGYLIAGFALHLAGFRTTTTIEGCCGFGCADARPSTPPSRCRPTASSD
jgi:hypothetical protein